MDFLDIICNVILSVIFAASFICIFFFTYAKNIEADIVVKNLVYIINNLISNPISLLKGRSLYDTSKLDNLKPSDHDVDEDNKVEKNNLILLNKSFKYIGAMLIIGLIVVFILSLYKYKNMKDALKYFGNIIIKNLIMLTGIAIVEYIFLNAVAAQYISADTNIIIKEIIDNINKIIHKNTQYSH